MFNREKMLLGKYYDLDEENKIVTISYSYNSVYDIIDGTLDNDEYLIKDEVMSRIINSLKMIPVIYKINVSLKIEDYSGFDKEKVVDAFEDAIEMNHYSLERESRRKWIKTSLLVIVGIIVLFFNAYAKKNGWYGNGETNVDIASEVFDIAAWVFIWEAVTIMFLTPTELPFNSNRLKLRVNQIKFIDNDNENYRMITFDVSSLKWDSYTKLDKISKTMLLIGGVALIGIGTCGIIAVASEAFEYLANNEFDWKDLTASAIKLVLDILEIITGIGTLSTYVGHGPFRKIASVASIVIALIIVVIVGFTILFGDIEFVISVIFSLSAYIIYLVGRIMQFFLSKRQKKIESK